MQNIPEELLSKTTCSAEEPPAGVSYLRCFVKKQHRIFCFLTKASGTTENHEVSDALHPALVTALTLAELLLSGPQKSLNKAAADSLYQAGCQIFGLCGPQDKNAVLFSCFVLLYFVSLEGSGNPF